jgi:hypothetical protein
LNVVSEDVWQWDDPRLNANWVHGGLHVASQAAKDFWVVSSPSGTALQLSTSSQVDGGVGGVGPGWLHPVTFPVTQPEFTWSLALKTNCELSDR